MTQTLSAASMPLSSAPTFGAVKIRPKVARITSSAQSLDAPAAEAQVSLHTAAPALRVSDALLEPLLADARERRASYGAAGIPFVSLAVIVLLIILA